ncbi:MAG: radical SAM family heme chaperone HemW [Eubacteriales bacterium]|nr:radical SAM family heme chaperone HemW [Eubacteriales bacterium]
MNKKSLGIYVHIPFCQRKCLYCDFNSYDHKNNLKETYTKALIQEIGAFCAEEYFVDSIFFGGGTPTALPLPLLDEILGAISSKFTISNDAEISCETNPGVLKDHSPLREIGFNRLSMGMQSTHDEELKKLGRIHTYDEFLVSYDNAHGVFENINIDTMFALPDQTVESWKTTLDRVKSLDPTHVSCYSLIVEEGTPFGEMELNLPQEDADREMYHMIENILSGYYKYEISNFAKPGNECKHNNKYWQLMPYIGFGCGAHSQLDNTRFSNAYDIGEYIKNPLYKDITELSKNDKISEYIFLGLRLTQGVNKQQFRKLFGQDIDSLFKDVIKKHTLAQTLISDENHIALTGRGIDISNSVMADFIL